MKGFLWKMQSLKFNKVLQSSQKKKKKKKMKSQIIKMNKYIENNCEGVFFSKAAGF